MIRKKKETKSATIIKDNKKWFINMSSGQLFQIKTDLFKRSLNVFITSKTLPDKDIIATTKDVVKNVEKEQTVTIRVKIDITHQDSKPLQE